MNDTERVEAFLEALARRNASPNTTYNYRCVLDVLLRQRKPLASYDLGSLEQFLARDRTRRGRGRDVAPSTVRREIATLRSFWGWCHVRGLLPSDPTRLLTAPSVHNDDPKPITADLWCKFWALQLDDTLAIACGLAYFCGLRRREICGLSWGQFLSYPFPRIDGVHRKGGRHMGVPWHSMVALHEQRLPHLGGARFRALLSVERSGGLCAEWDADGDGVVVPNQFNKRLNETLTRHSLPHFTPHQLRHSFVTNLLSVGIPIERVSRLAGHSNINITMRYADTGADPLAAYLDDDYEYVAPRTVDRWGRSGSPA